MRNKLLAVAAVSALTVGTAVPAMALENEFHGMFRVKGIIDNFNDGGGGTLVPGREDAKASAQNTTGTRSFMEQRARILYSAKASDDLKLITQFEIDSRWGDNSYNSNGTTRNNGGGIGADQVNLETKNVYLDFNIPSTPVNVKIGVQGYTDPYKGIIFNNDAAGIATKATFGPATIGATYFRFDDATTGSATATNSYLGVPSVNSGDKFIINQKYDPTLPISATNQPTIPNPNFGKAPINNATPGFLTRDFVNLSGKYSITKDISVGIDYFLLYSDVLRQSQDRTNIHMIGANAAATFGPATVDGFAIYQLGKVGSASAVGTSQRVSAFAANAGAKVKAGPGTARAQFLYISGDSETGTDERNDFQTIMERGATTSGHTFFPGEMMIMLRNKTNMNSDRALVFDLNNGGQGLIAGFAGYDLTINKFFVYTNAGFAAVAHAKGVHDSNYLATEVNTEIGYKLYDSLTASVQGAYMILGDYFDKTVTTKGDAKLNPENPYTAKVMFNYVF